MGQLGTLHRLSRLPLRSRLGWEQVRRRCLGQELALLLYGQATGALKAGNVGPIHISTFVQVPFAPGAGFDPEHLLLGLLAKM